MLFIMEVARVRGDIETVVDTCAFDAYDKHDAERKAHELALVVYQPFSPEERNALITRWMSVAQHIKQLRENGVQLLARFRRTRREFVFIPEGGPIRKGYYSRKVFVSLMREHKNNPDIIHYLADMLEE